MSNFYSGQKVVCIDDRNQELGQTVYEGKCYTVDKYTFEFPDCIYLKEFQSVGYFRPAYFEKRFRPLEEISDFTYNEAIEMVSQTVEV